MGQVFNVLGLSVTIDLTSVDSLCYSLDTIKNTFEDGLAQFAMMIVDLGILESLQTGKWLILVFKPYKAEVVDLKKFTEYYKVFVMASSLFSPFLR